MADASSTSADAATSSPLELLGPAIIADRYRVLRELGRGGAAVVWLAHDLVEDRDVAVKVLRPEIADTVASTRFLEEIRIVTELSHPHLLPILGSGEWKGLLYYVAPYIAEGSLRARLDRERQLPVDDALTIVKEVADALAYAHEHDVIHRDVKPENILIAGGHAWVADFGIARALTRAAGDRITSTGISVGTPAYMSPEQAAGNRDLDQRTDVYSLACVLYEMLAGVPPFVGPTPESVIAQRFVHAPHPLRGYRATVPAEVERAVQCAMAISPADRPRTMDDFATELLRPAASAARTLAAPGTAWRTRRWLLGGSAALVLAALAWASAARRRTDASVAAMTADTTRFVLTAFDGSGAEAISARQRLAAAFGRWRDITVVPMSADDGSDARLADGLASFAARAQAGRVVTARLAAIGDSIELSARVLGANGVLIRERVARASSRDSNGIGELYPIVAASLLSAADVDRADAKLAAGTDRVSSWNAFTGGRAALRRWELPAAIRLFRLAVERDPQFAQPQLWLAQSQAWARPDNPSEWQHDALRAVTLSAGSSQRDSLLATGVAQLASLDFPRACGTYRQVIALEPNSELGWLGLGQCQRMDPIVLPDARSPSGYRFRSSYHSAVIAYDSAIARARGAPAFAFSQYYWLVLAESDRVRQGQLLSSDSITFTSHPSIDADTIAFVPYLAAEIAAAAPRTLSRTFALALQRNAERLRARFQEWVRRSPADANALQALAYAQEVRGEFDGDGGGGLSALATLRKALRVSTDSLQRIRLATGIVRVLLKGEQYRDAHDAADSLLRANPAPSAALADYLAGVAALLGEVGRTERLLTIVASVPGGFLDPTLPAPLVTSVARLTADAALGVCDARLSTLLAESERMLERYVTPDRRALVRAQVLARPLSLAVPCLGPSIVERAPGTPNRLNTMQRALGRGEAVVVRAHLDTLERLRRVDRAGDISLEITYQEAWLLLAMADSVRAQRHLCTPLDALPTLGTKLLRDVPQAAAVARSFALCAQLALRRNDVSTARTLADAAIALWSTADSSLQSLPSGLRQQFTAPQ